MQESGTGRIRRRHTIWFCCPQSHWSHTSRRDHLHIEYWQSGSGEDLSNVSASESELVGDDTKSLIFGKTLMDEDKLDWMVTNRMVEKASIRFPKNETTPKPEPHECVVFWGQFSVGLRLPC